MSYKYTFPPNFKFGVGTSSYQIEGAWDVGGKSESIWDYQTHTFPERIADGSNGDIACDSYHKIAEDVANLKRLKVDQYRFSVSWPRILPAGYATKINADGVRYYNKLIDELIRNGIEPVITLFHWELPQCLENLGGFTNAIMADCFADFARVCYAQFGDRVKMWTTINEPHAIANYGYGGAHLAPFCKFEGIGSYLAGHTLILAHAKAYKVYQEEFKEIQNGSIGIALDTSWWEPYTKNDKDASERKMLFYLGWFMHPIFSEEGDYPKVMRTRIDALSKAQGFRRSRLPKFSPEEIELIRGSSDFLGLNHYTSLYVQEDANAGSVPSNTNDAGVKNFPGKEWKDTGRPGAKLVPWGLRKLLVWIKERYNNPEVVIMENGCGSQIGEFVDDDCRVEYYNEYLKEVLNAIHEDKCNVTGYFAWSFMDNYEWSAGYTIRFGLYHVDFNDPERTRTPKKSAFNFQNIIVTRGINENLVLDKFLH